MIELSNTVEQTIAAGESVTFDNVVFRSGCTECYRNNTGSVKMRSTGVYNIAFHANIGGATASTAVQLSIQLGGVTLPETTMISVPAAANDLNNVSSETLVSNNCCDYDRVVVTNTGTTSVIVGAGASLIVRRVL